MLTRYKGRTALKSWGQKTEIKFASHNGDEAILKARRVTSSTACSHVRRQGV